MYYDYWLDKVCRFVLFDVKVDILLFGNVECVLVEVVYCFVDGENIVSMINICGMAVNFVFELENYIIIDLFCIEKLGKVFVLINLYVVEI